MPTSRSRMLIASAAAIGLAGASFAWSSATAATGGATASSAARNVIVLLRDQHTDLTVSKGMSSARVRASQRDQAPLVASAKSLGARDVRGFSLVNGFAATMTAAQMGQLAANPAVAGVFPDLMRPRPTSATGTASATAAATATPKAAVSPSVATSGKFAVCPADPTKPLLEPEALQTTHTAFMNTATPQAQNLVTGAGVKVGWMADGIDVNNPDFIRADGSHVIVDYQDFSGEGVNAPSNSLESFGDASSIAAQGRQIYDLSGFVTPSHALPAGCNITVRGIAPGASLIGLKVFGNSNTAPTSHFIEAIDYAVNVAGVDVLNESFGANVYPDFSLDPVSLADDAAVAAGVTVVSSTGDAGTNGTIGSPSSDPNVIGVAGTTNFRSYQQIGLAGANLNNGTWASDNISSLSSGGITQAGRTPDIAAPGEDGWALCSPDPSTFLGCVDFNGNPTGIQDFGGTSQSSPLVAGASALVIAAYKQTHHGVRPAPALVKTLLTSTATDLGHPAYEGGAGEVNTLAAVRAAMSWHDANGSPARHTDAIIAGPTQLSADGNPGKTVHKTLQLTNASAQTQTVRLSTRTLGAARSVDAGTLAMDTATAPTFIDAFGAPRSYVKHTFTVRAGAARLNSSIAATTPISPMRFVLIDPSGTFQAFTTPQGNGNFGAADVRYPMAGRWSEYIYLSTSAPFNGPIQFRNTTERFTTAGSVSPPTLSIPAGATRAVTVTSHLSSEVGDVSAAVQVDRVNGDSVSVPLTLRTKIPTNHSSNTFAGLITGGNGRLIPQGGPGQSNVFVMDVPHGKADLSVGITLNKDPGDIISGVLTSPEGQVMSYQTSVNVDNAGNTIQSKGFQLYARTPAAGRWILSFLVVDPVTGLDVSQKFTARVAFNTVKVKASLPHSTASTLTVGVPVTLPVKVTNTSKVPLLYFADPRLNTIGDIPLADISGTPPVFDLPPSGGEPVFVVPSDITRLTVAANASTGVNLVIAYNSGNPELYAPDDHNVATINVDAANVSPGIWFTDVGQTGPFDGPAPAGTVSVNAIAHGQLFDPAVTSSTGDIWLGGVASADSAQLANRLRQSRAILSGRPVSSLAATPPAAPSGPLFIQPGETDTIWVTITPSAPKGSVVRGHLYIDTFSNVTLSADELIDLPYTYTIG